MPRVKENPIKKALFFQVGSFSEVNQILLDTLRKKFDYVDFEVLDIWPYAQYDFRNLWHVLIEYGWKLIRGKAKLSSCRLRTTYIFNSVRSRLLKFVADKDYLFTFQTQSLFDASTGKAPHFVYTDYAHLANLLLPGYPKDRLSSAKWIELESTIYQNATMVFTYSENIRYSLIHQYKIRPEKVKHVYAGINVPISPLKLVNTSKYTNKNILFVGMDWKRKGGPQLVQAFSKVLEKHPDASLTIVGASPKINLPNCSVLGKIPLEEVNKYYEQASIFCLPTLLEPFGIAFLEAMSHGLPVVATDTGSIPEFVINNKSGFLVPPRDINQLSERLIDLLDDPGKCRSLGEQGYKIVAKTYTWENTVGLMYDHITDYLKSNHLL